MDSTNPSKPISKVGVISVKRELEISERTEQESDNVNISKVQRSGEREASLQAYEPPSGSSGGVGQDVVDLDVTSGSGESHMDANKVNTMQHIVENSLSQDARSKINNLLSQVETLTSAEKLLFFLKLPTGPHTPDPLKLPINPLGSRSEIQQTVAWIQTHLEVDPEVSLPKQDVYDEYIEFSMSINMKPLSTADFGKVMKQVYPTVRPRRLGTRGNSRYCYAGLRKKIKIEVPQLPDLFDRPKKRQSIESTSQVSSVSAQLIKEWAEKILFAKFGSLGELANYLVGHNCVEANIQTYSMFTSPKGQDDEASVSEQESQQSHPRGVIKQLKRKVQTQSSPGRPKKVKIPETTPEYQPPPLTQVTDPEHPIKTEMEQTRVPSPEVQYSYSTPYIPIQPYDTRPSYLLYQSSPSRSAHTHSDYVDPYKFDPYRRESHIPQSLSIAAVTPNPRYAHGTSNVPINLSSDRPPYYQSESIPYEGNTSLDLSAPIKQEMPPNPPPTKLPPLPGKKMILEAYHHEQAMSPSQSEVTKQSNTNPNTEEAGMTIEYLPKKMRAAEISGGKLSASRQAQLTLPLTSPKQEDTRHIDVKTSQASTSSHNPVTFFEDPKNVITRSRNQTAALVPNEDNSKHITIIEHRPTKPTRGRPRKNSPSKAKYVRRKGRKDEQQSESHQTDPCCGLDGINIKTGIICKENHSEILNRERVSSICSMDKHALDDYLNESNSQENEEELMQYFQHDSKRPQDPNIENEATSGKSVQQKEERKNTNECIASGGFLEPSDGGKSEKIIQLRELLAKNLRNHNRTSSPQMGNPANDQMNSADAKITPPNDISGNMFKSIAGPKINTDNVNQLTAKTNNNSTDNNIYYTQAGSTDNITHESNGLTPQSPSLRTPQYDFVPISPSNISPRNLNSQAHQKESTNMNKINNNTEINSATASPVSRSTEASPFVSPRNTPVPRAKIGQKPNKFCRKKPTAAMTLLKTPFQKNFVIPTEQGFNPNCVRLRQPPMSAPPSPNILTSRYKTQFNMFAMVNGHSPTINTNINTSQVKNDNTQQYHSDPLSCEVSQFFQDGSIQRQEMDPLRSQSAPLNKNFIMDELNSYDPNYQVHNAMPFITPMNSVPPTPVPQEYSDFGFNETCESLSKAGLNPETLNKIYNVLDNTPEEVLNSREIMKRQLVNSKSTNQMPQGLVADENFDDLLEKNGYSRNLNSVLNESSDSNDDGKRANSMEYELSELAMDKNKYFSRSVPSTPLPYKKNSFNNLNLNHNICKNLIPELNAPYENNIISKSVPSTPLLPDERNMFNYNRDYLINGNSLEINTLNDFGGKTDEFENEELKETFLNGNESIEKNNAQLIETLQESPLEDILQTDCMDIHEDLQSFSSQSIEVNTHLLEDFDKIEPQAYGVI